MSLLLFVCLSISLSLSASSPDWPAPPLSEPPELLRKTLQRMVPLCYLQLTTWQPFSKKFTIQRNETFWNMERFIRSKSLKGAFLFLTLSLLLPMFLNYLPIRQTKFIWDPLSAQTFTEQAGGWAFDWKAFLLATFTCLLVLLNVILY